MKDPHDPGTIDGFADLLHALDDETPKEPAKPMIDPHAPHKPTPEALALALEQLTKRLRRELNEPRRGVGRPPKGERAQTPAEKQKAYRDRKRAERDAAQ